MIRSLPQGNVRCATPQSTLLGGGVQPIWAVREAPGQTYGLLRCRSQRKGKGEDHDHREDRRGNKREDRHRVLAPTLSEGRNGRGGAGRLRTCGVRAQGQERDGRDGQCALECSRHQLGRGDRSARRGLGLCRSGRRLRGRQGRRCGARHREAQDGRRQLGVRRRTDRRGGLGRSGGRRHRGQHRDLHERRPHRWAEPELQGQAAAHGREVQRGIRVRP